MTDTANTTPDPAVAKAAADAAKAAKTKTAATAPDPVSPDPAADEAEPAMPPAPFLFRPRADCLYVVNGHPHKLKANSLMSSQEYNVDALLAQGAQLDMLDADGTVLLNLNTGE